MESNKGQCDLKETSQEKGYKRRNKYITHITDNKNKIMR